MTLPNTVIVGMGRSGTTALAVALGAHPDAWFVTGETKFRLKDSVKHMEMGYFAHSNRYEKGLEWYSKFFEEGEGYKCIGEKTPSYFHQEAAIRMKKDLGPDIKNILCVREPVARTYSHWAHFQGRSYGFLYEQYKNLSFEESIARDVNKFCAKQPDHKGVLISSTNSDGQHASHRRGALNQSQLLQNSDYYSALRNLQNIWGKDQVYLMILERYKLNPQLEYNKLTDWIGLDRFNLPEHKMKDVNSNDYKKIGEIDEKTTKRLRGHFEGMKKEFYGLIGGEIEEWEE